MISTAPAVETPDRVTPGSASRRRRLKPTPYVLIIPTLILIGLLLLWPIIQLAIYSFQKYGIQQSNGVPPQYIGFENYRTIFKDQLFWTSLRNTVGFAAVTVVLTMIIGTLAGLLINQLGPKMSKIVAAGTLVAWATPAIAAALVFDWLFGSTGGLVDYLLAHLPHWLVGSGWSGCKGWSQCSWTSTPLPTYIVAVICVVWQSFPFIAVMVLAGLKSLPSEMFEAAKIDGSSPWRTFWSITYPQLRTIFLTCLVLSIIWDFKVLTQLFVLEGGLANRDAYNLSLFSYSQAFGSTIPHYGLGAAIAMVLTVMVLIATAVYVTAMVRQKEAE